MYLLLLQTTHLLAETLNRSGTVALYEKKKLYYKKYYPYGLFLNKHAQNKYILCFNIYYILIYIRAHNTRTLIYIYIYVHIMIVYGYPWAFPQLSEIGSRAHSDRNTSYILYCAGRVAYSVFIISQLGT